MAMQKISDTEAADEGGVRITFNQHALIYMQGTRYLTFPYDRQPDGEMRIYLTKMGTWMENGQPCESEGTMNVARMRARIAEALVLLGRKHSFDR